MQVNTSLDFENKSVYQLNIAASAICLAVAGVVWLQVVISVLKTGLIRHSARDLRRWSALLCLAELTLQLVYFAMPAVQLIVSTVLSPTTTLHSILLQRTVSKSITNASVFETRLYCAKFTRDNPARPGKTWTVRLVPLSFDARLPCSCVRQSSCSVMSVVWLWQIACYQGFLLFLAYVCVYGPILLCLIQSHGQKVKETRQPAFHVVLCFKLAHLFVTNTPESCFCTIFLCPHAAERCFSFEVVVLNGLLFGAMQVNLISCMLPNIYLLHDKCAIFSKIIHWSAWAQWTCWNTVRLRNFTSRLGGAPVADREAVYTPEFATVKTQLAETMCVHSIAYCLACACRNGLPSDLNLTDNLEVIAVLKLFIKPTNQLFLGCAARPSAVPACHTITVPVTCFLQLCSCSCPS